LSYFGLIRQGNIFPIALWLDDMTFSKLQMGSNVLLLGEQLHSPCNSAIHSVVVQCSPDGGLMTFSQCELGLELL